MIPTFSSYSAPEPSRKLAMLSLNEASNGEHLRLTIDLGDVKAGSVYKPIAENLYKILLDEGFPEYKIKLKGIGEFCFVDESNTTLLQIIGGLGKEKQIDKLFEFVNINTSLDSEHNVIVVPPVVEQIVSVPIKGDTGTTGDVGSKGDRGDRGFIGARGETGDTGPQGPQGPQGIPGERGTDGLQGQTGPKGDQGDRGDKGDVGNIGPQGEKGEKGDPGIQGLVGSIGPTGNVGSSGAKGERGEKGDTGSDGTIGPKGETGPQGIPGTQGKNGKQGKAGVKGDVGERGEKGDKGDKGDPGEVGVATAKYPLKLNEKILSIEQQFLQDIVTNATSKHSAQGGGGGNLIVKHEGRRLTSAAKSINFTGSAISSVSTDGKNININVVGGEGGSPTSNRFSYTDEPPENPINGDRWFESDTGKYFVYIDDEDSSQWVQIVTSTGSSTPSPITLPFVVSAEINTDNELILIYNNESTLNVGVVEGTPGPIGLTGAKGDTGSTGATGATGVTGTSVSNADVNTNGDLILTLTDATVINVGNVVGADGATGPTEDLISVFIDSTPDDISIGKKAHRLIPYDCQALEWYIVAGQTGSIQFDVKKSTFANYPSTTSIVGSDYPSLSGQFKNSNTGITAWSGMSAGDMIDFVINSNTDIQSVGLFIKIRRIT